MTVLTLLRDAADLFQDGYSRPGVVSAEDPILAPLIEQWFPGCDPAEARALVALYARAVDLPGVPVLPHWLAALQPALQPLFGHAFYWLQAPQEILAEVDQLERRLAQALQGIVPRLPSPMRDFPLAAFVGAFTTAIRPSPTSATLAAFGRHGLRLMLTLRAFERDMRLTGFGAEHIRRNLYDYGVALRRVVPHLPQAGDDLPWTPEQIEAAIMGLHQDLVAQGLKTLTVAAQCRQARMLLERNLTIRSKHSTHPRVTTHHSAGRLRPTLSAASVRPVQWIEDTPQSTGMPQLGTGTVTRLSMAVNLPAAAIDEGESIYEHTVQLLIDDEPHGDPYLAILRLRHGDAAQAREMVGAISGTPIQLRDLHRLEEALAERVGRGDATVTDLAVALLTYYFIPVPRLLEAEWAMTTDPVPDRLWLDPEGVMSYRLRDDEVGWQGRALPGGPNLYQPGGAVVRLPLLEGVRLLAQAVAHRPRRRRAIFEGLDRAQLDGAVGALLGRPLSATTLQHGCERWLMAAGLERAYGTIVRSRTTNITRRATNFYVNVDPGRVAQAQAAAAHRVATLGGEAPSPLRVLFHAPCSIELPHCGSRIVPQEEPVRAFFRAVRTTLAELAVPGTSEARIRAHNLHLLYTYLSYLWATAVRPSDGGVPDRGDLTTSPNGVTWVRVRDKSNRTHAEARVIPLPEVMTTLLDVHRVGSERTFRLLTALGVVTRDSADEDTLFFVIDRHRIRPLNEPGTQVREILRTEGLEELYPFPLNVPRHFWITWALAQGYPLDQLEPHLGHQHSGHEAMAWYALESQYRSCSLFREVGTRIVDLVEIIPMPYPGQGAS